jgi:hypothetical protein
MSCEEKAGVLVKVLVANGRAERKGGALGRGRSRGLSRHLNEAHLSHEMHEILKDQ